MTPLYLQLAQTLKDEILTGVYPVGSQLPTEEELAARFKVSRATVREALRKLRDDNLVLSRRGAGTTVARAVEAHQHVRELASINDLVAFAHGTRYQIESMQVVTSDQELAQRLGCAVGYQWLAIAGNRYAPDSELPVCRTEVFIDAEYAGVGRLIERHRGPIFELIEDLYGVSVGEVTQELTAGPAPDNLASGLKIEPGSTVIHVNRTFRLTSGKVSQLVFNFHPADRFRFSMTIRRVKS